MLASIRAGYSTLAATDNPMDAVEAAVRVMEDSPAFNAGCGSVTTDTGEIEMDAIIVNGTDLSCGAVGAMKHVRNPISVARFVMNSTRHVLLVGKFAEVFAESKGVELVPTSELIANGTEGCGKKWKYYHKIQADHERNNVIKHFVKEKWPEGWNAGVGTVGAVAINSKGNIAVATSTGGLRGKMEGRVGDSPIIGAGTLADDEVAGISGTGTGEAFIKYRVASKTASFLESVGNPTQEDISNGILAVLNGMTEKVSGSEGGCIVIHKSGQLGFNWNSEQMAWSYVKGSEAIIHYGVNRGEDFTEHFAT